MKRQAFFGGPSARTIVLNNFKKELLEKADKEVLQELYEKYPNHRQHIKPYLAKANSDLLRSVFARVNRINKLIKTLK